jgi:hypothetical protein
MVSPGVKRKISRVSCCVNVVLQAGAKLRFRKRTVRIPVFGNHFRDDDDDRNLKLKVWIHRLMKAIRVAICSSTLVTPKLQIRSRFYRK